jgi:hypothetical protein
MADSPVPRPPARLDRSSLERVLARAAELQGSSPDAADPSEEFTEEQLIELGKEVGLSPQNLRQALAEERTRSILPTDEHGVGARLFGPGRVGASRTVPGKSADVLAAVDAWMQRQELLVVKRYHSERIVWEAHQGVFAGVKRAFRVGGRDYALALAHEVSASVIQVDEGRTHVVLDAAYENVRWRAVQQAAGSSVVGAAVTASAFVMGITAVVAAAPVVLVSVAGMGAARAYHRRIVTRAQLALEQLLDRLERGEIGRRGGDRLLDAIVAAASAATSLPPRRP